MLCSVKKKLYQIKSNTVDGDSSINRISFWVNITIRSAQSFFKHCHHVSNVSNVTTKDVMNYCQGCDKI